MADYGQERAAARALARLSAGCAGWAVRAAQDPAVLAQRGERMAELADLLHAGRAGRIRAAENLAERKDLAQVLAFWQAWWRDVMLIGRGCPDLAANLDLLPGLEEAAAECSPEVAEAAVRGCVAALQQLEQNVNPRLAVEVLLLGWARLRTFQAVGAI